MRVSNQQRYQVAESRIERAKTQNTETMEQISTQKRINRISDDPIGFGQAIRRQSSISEMNQFEKNVEFSRGYIERAEVSLMGIQDNLIRAKELAITMANDTYDADSRAISAKEVQQLIDEVVGLANSQYGNRFVFGGFRAQTPPLSHEGHYLGDDGAIFLQVERGTFRQINVQARGLFEADPSDRENGRIGMIQTLEVLRNALLSNSVDGIRKAMQELDYQSEKTTSYQASLGAIYSSLDNTLRQLDISKEVATKELSRIEDADAFKIMSDFKRTESVLQSTLLASNKLLQPSLMNFIQ